MFSCAGGKSGRENVRKINRAMTHRELLRAICSEGLLILLQDAVEGIPSEVLPVG